MLAANHRAKKLSFTSDAGEAVREGEVIFICVGTPPLENGEADLSAIDNVARLIATEACESKLIVEKSTVPAKTGQQLKRVLEVYRRNGSAEFRVASNPEFLREGTAVEDFLHPDRIVFGVFCLPKDVQAFIRLAEHSGVDFSMLKEAERINKRRIEQFLNKIRQALWVVKDKKVGVLGLAFKANTDDIRFAPSLDVLRKL